MDNFASSMSARKRLGTVREATSNPAGCTTAGSPKSMAALVLSSKTAQPNLPDCVVPPTFTFSATTLVETPSLSFSEAVILPTNATASAEAVGVGLSANPSTLASDGAGVDTSQRLKRSLLLEKEGVPPGVGVQCQ